MCSKVEKLYEFLDLKYCKDCRKFGSVDCYYLCENKYPEFTAEKQLNLFKWIAIRNGWYDENSYEGTFEEALADLVLSILKSLKGYRKEVEEERIKEILR